MSGWRTGVLDPQGPVAAAEHSILMNATLVMLAVAVVVIVATLAFAWWFREGNVHARRRPQWAYSGPIEVTVWAIPVLMVMFLGGLAWIGSHQLDPQRPIDAPQPPLDVQVVSLDWQWLFIYPAQGIASLNRLVVPAGRPLRLRLTSASVMNSFFVPQLGSQIYTMPGMTTTLHLLAGRPGSYAGLSAQFSGDGFSDMRFDVLALSPPEFERWQASTQAGPGRLDAARYAVLAQPAAASGPASFGSVAPQLFESIVAAVGPVCAASAPVARGSL
ncbi:ubiquinol oxidase subunit II [Roseateles sp.]|uniref:ubiquinol oxidase subunit II n=1 Tax=Roseateles sp. TaxID=1971397 RepID=UPI0032675DE2